MSKRLHDWWQRWLMTTDEAATRARLALRSGSCLTPDKPLQLGGLEPRILFSATPIDPAMMPGGDESAMVVEVEVEESSKESDVATIDSVAEQTAGEVIFIDSAVPDIQQLLDDLSASGRDAEVFVLDADRDGVDQITEILDSRTDIDSIHIVSHAENGAVKLGNVWLGESSLDGYAGQIASWQSTLSADADILLYGCDLAGSISGQTLIESLAALSGADVAASTNDTGHEDYLADWDLEYASGVIDSQIAFSDQLQQDWRGKLSNITVTTFADVVAADGFTSLREAIMTVNAGGGGDTVDLRGMGTDLFELVLGDLHITNDMTIRGNGIGATTIDGGGLDRVFDVQSGTVVIRDLTIQNGVAGPGGGLKLSSGATADLTNVDVRGNQGSDGGGIHSNGTLTLTDVTIDGNSATWGGGLYLGGGSATLERVTISDNTSTNNGGGIYNFAASSASLTNVTVSGNSSTANNGGGIWTKTAMIATNVTIANNYSLVGGSGIHVNGSGDATLTNSILHNPLGLNSNVVLTSGGFNIDSDGTAGLAGAGDINGVDPLLGVLTDNGGSTFTHALLAGSAAINAGTSTGAPTTDQAGTTRDSLIDIGAVEFQLSGNLWFSTEQNGDDNNGTSWNDDDVLQLSNPDLAYETTSSTTDGTITRPYVDFDGVTTDANIRALHYVTTDITVGTGAQVALEAGDILVSFREDVDLVIENDAQTLQTVTNKSLLAYRPSEGKWYMVLDNPVIDGTARNIHAITLVEHDTFVGTTATMLNRGDFLISYSGGTPKTHQNVYWYQTANVGPSSTDPMVGTLLLEGVDIGIPDVTHVQGLELAETNITMQDGTVVPAGAIIMTLSLDTTVAGTATQLEDVFYVVPSVTEVEGATTAVAVTMLLEGNDIGIDSAITSEMINALAIAPNNVPTDITPDSFSVNENINTTGGYSVGTLSASDLDTGDTFSYSIVGGVDEAKFSTAGDQLVLDDGLLDFETKSSYSVTVRVTDSGFNTYDKTLTVSVYDRPEFSNSDEFLVNDTDGDQQVTSGEDRGSQQAISMAADGSYVVVWSSLNQDGSGQGVYAQRFSSTGALISSEVPVNETPTNDQQWARVASAADGTFVVTWTSNQGTTERVNYRRFDADGTALTGELVANTTTAGSQENSVIAMDSTTGGFVIAWEGNGDQAGHVDGSGIFAQRFDAAGVAIGDEFRVNTDTTGTQSDVSIDVNENGEFVVVWDDGDGVHFQRFDNAGATQGGQTTVDGSNVAGNGAVAIHSDGSFVVTWREGSISSRDVYARRFSDSGAPLTAILTVNTVTSNNQTNPSISMDSSGNFIIVWEGEGVGDDDGVFAQKFDSLGATNGGNFLVNQTLSGTQSKASVAMGDAENFVVVWSGNGDRTDQVDTSGVFARQYGTAINNPPTLSATGSNPTFTEDGAPVTLFTAASADSIEPNQTFAELTLTVTNVVDGADEILFADGHEIELTDTNTGTTTTNGLSYNVSVAGGTATVTLSGGSLAKSELETLINSLTYENESDDPGLTSRVVSLIGLKDSGGTTGGGDDSVTLSIASTVSLTAENDEPTLSGGPYNLTGTDEETASTGEQVSTMLAGLTTEDADGDTLGLAITTASGNGTWQYSVDSTDGSDGSWTDFPNVDNDTALLLSSTSWVRYAPDTLSGETASLTFHAWDGTTGTSSTGGSPSLGDTTGGGGTTAYSDSSAEADLVVSSLNDAPVLADESPRLGDIDENDFTSSGDLVRNVVVNGSITDVDGSAVESIAITAVDNSDGIWQYSTDDGGTWNAVDDGSLAEDHALLLDGTLTGASTHRLRFVPNAGFEGNATLTFRAWDMSFGTTNTYANTTSNGASTAFSTATDTASITVNPIAFNVSSRETIDFDDDGQIDHIKITTSENLDDDFSGLNITVTGYTLDATTPYVTNIGSGGANDNVFFVMLQESGTPDTGATPVVTIAANSSLGEVGGGSSLATDSSGVAATDTAEAVLISAISAQVVGTNLFQVVGHQLDFVFSETLSSLPSEGDLESALTFASGAIDGDNLPSIGTGVNPLSLITTTITNDTIRITLNSNNIVNTGGLLVGTHSVQVTDGSALTDLSGNAANTMAAQTIVGDINDAPTLTATADDPTFTEGGTAASLFSNADADTIESLQSFTELTLTVTNVNDGTDELLNADNSNITLTDGTTGITTTNSLSYSVNVTGGVTSVTFSGGSLNATEFETLVNSLTYQNDSADPNTADRVVTLTEVKDSGGNAGGGSDTTSLSISSTVTVNGANNAPTLAGGPYSLTGTDEDTSSPGVQVSTIVSGLVTGDSDGDTLGLAVITAAGNGTWQYSTDSTDGSDGTWTDFGSVASNSALLLSNTSWIRYDPDAANGEIASVVFHAWDASTGTASTAGSPSNADPDGGGGSTSYSNTTAQANLVVSDVNDAPTDITLDNRTVDENANGAVIGNLGVVDPDAVDTHTWSVNDARFEIVSGKLQLKALQSLDYEREPTVTLTITVTDQGGTGVDFDKPFVITVDNVNEAPIADVDTYSVTAGRTLNVAASGVLDGDSDPEMDSLSAVLLVDVTSGTLTLNSDGSFVYKPNAGFSGIDSFFYEASDGSKSSASTLVTINVQPIIAPPPPPPKPTPDLNPEPDPDNSTEESDEDESEEAETADAVPGVGEGPDQSITTTDAVPAAVIPETAETLADGSDSLTNLLDSPLHKIVADADGRTVRTTAEEAISTAERSLLRQFASLATTDHLLMSSPGLMWNALDEQLDHVESQIQGDLIVVGAAGAAASSFTVGAVAWALRTGFLASGLLAQMPAWKAVDPLLVMQGLGETGDEETLQEMMNRQSQSLDAGAAGTSVA